MTLLRRSVGQLWPREGALLIDRVDFGYPLGLWEGTGTIILGSRQQANALIQQLETM